MSTSVDKTKNEASWLQDLMKRIVEETNKSNDEREIQKKRMSIEEKKLNENNKKKNNKNDESQKSEDNVDVDNLTLDNLTFNIPSLSYGNCQERARSVCVLNDRIVVCCLQHLHVLDIKRSGRQLLWLGAEGLSKGEYRFLWDVVPLKSNSPQLTDCIVISETFGNAVHLINPVAGNVLRVYKGHDVAMFIRPHGVTVDYSFKNIDSTTDVQTAIIVCDGVTHKILWFDPLTGDTLKELKIIGGCPMYVAKGSDDLLAVTVEVIDDNDENMAFYDVMFFRSNEEVSRLSNHQGVEIAPIPQSVAFLGDNEFVICDRASKSLVFGILTNNPRYSFMKTIKESDKSNNDKKITSTPEEDEIPKEIFRIQKRMDLFFEPIQVFVAKDLYKGILLVTSADGRIFPLATN
ncbi:hypothetical protein SNEBB_006123 [Seison nebaliae]|nr:hypothetical protein SNEBB_006123 [Seison nebaliae]